jgi:hypothetical protein
MGVGPKWLLLLLVGYGVFCMDARGVLWGREEVGLVTAVGQALLAFQA